MESSFNEMERRHVRSLAEIRETASINIVDEYVGRHGPDPGAVPDLADLNPGWSDLVLDPAIFVEGLRFDEFSIHWEVPDSAERLSGEYRILAPSEMLAQEPPSAGKRSNDFQRQFLSELRAIDAAYDSSRGWASYVQLVPKESPLPIWYRAHEVIEIPPYPMGFFRLDLTYNQYLAMLVDTKGVYGWQYLFADVSFDEYELDGAADRLQRMLGLFPSIFPDHDYSDLAARLEARL